MARRIVRVILALAVSCLMQVKVGATVCPAGPRDLTAFGNDEAGLQQHSAPSSQTGHKCCPPVPSEQDSGKHATAGKPDCRLKSADCCLAKEPAGQLPASKTTGPGSSGGEGLTRVAFRTPEECDVHWVHSPSLRPDTGPQMSAVLRI